VPAVFTSKEMLYRYGNGKKTKLEYVLLVISELHLASCCMAAWLGMVILALMITFGKGPDTPPTLTLRLAFCLGAFITWVVVATLGSVAIIAYFWSRQRRQPHYGSGECLVSVVYVHYQLGKVTPLYTLKKSMAS